MLPKGYAVVEADMHGGQILVGMEFEHMGRKCAETIEFDNRTWTWGRSESNDVQTTNKLAIPTAVCAGPRQPAQSVQLPASGNCQIDSECRDGHSGRRSAQEMVV